MVLQRDLYRLYHLYREGWVIHQRHGSAPYKRTAQVAETTRAGYSQKALSMPTDRRDVTK